MDTSSPPSKKEKPRAVAASPSENVWWLVSQVQSGQGFEGSSGCRRFCGQPPAEEPATRWLFSLGDRVPITAESTARPCSPRVPVQDLNGWQAWTWWFGQPLPLGRGGGPQPELPDIPQLRSGSYIDDQLVLPPLPSIPVVGSRAEKTTELEGNGSALISNESAINFGAFRGRKEPIASAVASTNRNKLG